MSNSNLHIRDALQNASAGSLLRSSEILALREPLSRIVGEKFADDALNWAGIAGLRHMDAAELASVAAIPEEAAQRIVLARELYETLVELERPVLLSSRDVLPALPPGLGNFETEVLLACMLNARSELIATVVLAKGGVNGMALTAKDVFIPAVRLGASAIVLVHNHPSGCADPSEDDVRFTNRVSALGLALGIRVVDHLIVGGRHVLSFADTGLLPQDQEVSEVDHG